MVPRSLRCEGRCLSIGTDRDAVVPEQRVTQAHERMEDVILGAVSKHAPQMQRGLPRVVFEAKLGEVTVREERGVAALFCCRRQLRQQALGALGRCFERFFSALPKLFDRACPLAHLYAYSRSLF